MIEYGESNVSSNCNRRSVLKLFCNAQAIIIVHFMPSTKKKATKTSLKSKIICPENGRGIEGAHFTTGAAAFDLVKKPSLQNGISVHFCDIFLHPNKFNLLKKDSEIRESIFDAIFNEIESTYQTSLKSKKYEWIGEERVETLRLLPTFKKSSTVLLNFQSLIAQQTGSTITLIISIANIIPDSVLSWRNYANDKCIGEEWELRFVAKSVWNRLVVRFNAEKKQNVSSDFFDVSAKNIVWRFTKTEACFWREIDVLTAMDKSSCKTEKNGPFTEVCPYYIVYD